MLKGHLPGTGRPAIYLLTGGNVVAMVFTPERHNLIQSQGNVSQTQTAGPSTKSPASARHEGQGREAPSVRRITPGCGGRGAACGVWARPGHERQAGTLLGQVAGLQAARPHSRGCRRVSFLMARTALGRVARHRPRELSEGAMGTLPVISAACF